MKKKERIYCDLSINQGFVEADLVPWNATDFQLTLITLHI